MRSHQLWSGEDTSFIEVSDLATLPTAKLLKNAKQQLVHILMLANVE